MQNDISERKNKALLNTVQEILLETPNEKDPQNMSGRTQTNKTVSVSLNGKHRTLTPGDLLNVRIIKANRHSLDGIIEEGPNC